MTRTNKDSSFSIRLDSQLKADAEELFAELGLSLGSALNIFLRQSVRLKGFPFSLTLDTRIGKEKPEDKKEESTD